MHQFDYKTHALLTSYVCIYATVLKLLNQVLVTQSMFQLG